MSTEEIQFKLSAQEAKFISGALKSSPDTKLKIDQLLEAWAENVLSEEQNTYIEDYLSNTPNGQRLIGGNRVNFALVEPAAAEEDAIEVDLDRDDLERLKPEIESELQFIELIALRDKKHILEQAESDGLPEDDEEVQMEFLNSESRFGAKKRIGERVLMAIEIHLQD